MTRREKKYAHQQPTIITMSPKYQLKIMAQYFTCFETYGMVSRFEIIGTISRFETNGTISHRSIAQNVYISMIKTHLN